ncbi:MAG: hypothetical protein RI941_1049 [Pseudomonadota bacterium]|jgi:hypothetical protein
MNSDQIHAKPRENLSLYMRLELYDYEVNV